ncbi:hypothetical protein EC9_23640 [Rosistilla ulvae]|uniref:Uncharacterized protein n=1 Tax=Rosistilla ulvae TaxID=1930277 RepID=A0A517LZX8_9BACT|nr:hypothetical protein EC9_23640 [Rosistilla ulvae]
MSGAADCGDHSDHLPYNGCRYFAILSATRGVVSAWLGVLRCLPSSGRSGETIQTAAGNMPHSVPFVPRQWLAF